jgi:hypothetical protein
MEMADQFKIDFPVKFQTFDLRLLVDFVVVQASIDLLR